MKSKLFSPITMRGATFPNRVVVSPMCQYSASDGSANDWHLAHIGQLAMSGSGLVIHEATHVERRGRITPNCLGLYSDDNEYALEKVLNFARRYGQSPIGIQLAHAGNKASTQRPWEGRGPLTADEDAWLTVSSSPKPARAGWHTPQMLDRDGMNRVKQSFVDATIRSARLGYDIIEMHSAHAYLMHEFLSPLMNERNDEYGGTLQNRMKYPLEVFEAIRAAWPADKPLGLRVSATDWTPGGWTIEDSVVYAKELKALGCDYICASSGGGSDTLKITLGPGYQVPFAAQIRKEAGIPTMAVGMIFEPEYAESIIADGLADMVALGRGMLYNPRWAWHAAAALGTTAPYPPQYARSEPAKWPEAFPDMRQAAE